MKIGILGKFLVSCFICLLCNSYLYAQIERYIDKYKPQPLDSFLVKHTDTVFVINQPHYKFGNVFPIVYLTKKGDTVNLFKCANAYTRNYAIPAAIRNKLSETHKVRSWSGTPIEFDTFFLPVKISPQDVKALWSNLIALKPLEMLDDNRLGAGCDPSDLLLDPPSHKRVIRFTMLTQNEVKHFYFYGAEDYEKKCVSRPGRITILKIEKLFSAYVNFTENSF